MFWVNAIRFSLAALVLGVSLFAGREGGVDDMKAMWDSARTGAWIPRGAKTIRVEDPNAPSAWQKAMAKVGAVFDRFGG